MSEEMEFRLVARDEEYSRVLFQMEDGKVWLTDEEDGEFVRLDKSQARALWELLSKQFG